jgi:hypothetical protein
MFGYLKKQVEFPRSGPLFYVLAILAIALMISNFAKGSLYFGYYILTFSILISITGFGMAFSKRERERTRAQVTADLPERTSLINAPDSDKIAQRRGYYTLVIGITLFLIWCWFFGFSSLAIGV